MAVVVAALLPVFLLIVLGFILKRTLMRLETQWHGLERLTYYVLFPVLLIQTLVKADLSKVPVAGVGGALLLSALLMSVLCLALRPLLARGAVDGPAFTSVFQGAIRWQTYVALAVSGSLFGDAGLALASVAMVAIIPWSTCSASAYSRSTPRPKNNRSDHRDDVVRNPLIWACAIGLLINVTHLPCQSSGMTSPTRWAASSLAIGLLVTGAGLHLNGMFRPSLAASVAVFLKLVLMPVIAVALALWFGCQARTWRSSRRARRCRPHRAPMCWPGRWAAMRLCWRRHHAADHSGGDHDANRDCARGDIIAFSAKWTPVRVKKTRQTRIARRARKFELSPPCC